MIHLKEIRLGNTVEFRTFSIKGCFRISEQDLSRLCEGAADDIHPIPLTAEWLERYGFIKNEPQPAIVQYDLWEGEFTAEISKEGVVSVSPVPMYWIDVKAVHHLQNIVYCLSGRELEGKV